MIQPMTVDQLEELVDELRRQVQEQEARIKERESRPQDLNLWIASLGEDMLERTTPVQVLEGVA